MCLGICCVNAHYCGVNVMVLSVEDARQSALFFLLGHYYEYDIERISRIMQTSPGILAGEIQSLGISPRNVGDHPLGFCSHCSRAMTTTHCNHCKTYSLLRWCRSCKQPSVDTYCPKCRLKGSIISFEIKHGYIPLTISNNLLYDLRRERIVRLYKPGETV